MKIMDREKLKYYARMAAESYVDDPVHSYATKSVERRKKFVYHFMMERLATSNREDIIYFDEQERGLCVWRDAHNEYTMFDFLKCPNWVFLAYYWWHTAKTLKAYSHLDSKVFEKNTLIISPVFVDKKHQGQGIATKLIQRGIDELVPQGYKLGLETQNPDNVGFYEKLGFKTVKFDYWKSEKIHNYYMVYDGSKEK
ncbi:MAG: GNAT family N-acetyltransferase [Clostridia bacterium]|nr:GNAT family N-acetyltransferase [Clostridia bacterium]